MHILIIKSVNPYFSNSASSNRWLSLIEGVLKNNPEIEICLTHGYGNLKEFKNHCFARKNVSGLKFRYFSPLINLNKYVNYINTRIIWKIIRPLIEYYACKKIIRKKPDLIWCSSEISSFNILLKVKKKLPQTKTFMELNEYLNIHREKKNINPSVYKEEEKVFQLFENKVFHLLDGMALMTKALLKYHKELPGPAPEFVHLPMTVDLSRFENIPIVEGFDSPYIAYIGALNNKKDGIDILIESFSRIAEEFPDISLFLIGGLNHDIPEQQKRIRELGLERRIIYKGSFGRDEIPFILKKAQLLLLPRPDSKQARGGFPTKLGEYLASKTPVCATSVGEIPDYLEHKKTAFLAEPGSADSFFKAMQAALSDKNTANEIGKNGYDIAKLHFNKENQSIILHKFLNNILNNKN